MAAGVAALVEDAGCANGKVLGVLDAFAALAAAEAAAVEGANPVAKVVLAEEGCRGALEALGGGGAALGAGCGAKELEESLVVLQQVVGVLAAGGDGIRARGTAHKVHVGGAKHHVATAAWVQHMVVHQPLLKALWVAWRVRGLRPRRRGGGGGRGSSTIGTISSSSCGGLTMGGTGSRG